VRIDGQKIIDPKQGVVVGFSGVLQSGKRDIARISVVPTAEN
jgi:hypothetical protein